MLSVNHKISDFISLKSSPGTILAKNVAEWRDEKTGGMRKVVAGFTMAASSLINLVDLVLSAAATVLTSPLLLVGSNIPKNFAHRTVQVGITAVMSLTVLQYFNITKESICDSINELFGSE